MPRNGSGTFTVLNPPFVPGTPISSSAVNGDLSDIADGLTGSLPRDGQAGMSGQFKAADGTVIAPGISFASDPNTGIRRVAADSLGIVAGGADIATVTTTDFSFAQTVNAAKAVNLAASVTVPSATTTDLGAAASNNVTMSGTATVTSFGTASAGITRDVTASGAFTLTHNGSSLILPGSANIVAVAGDTFSALSLGSGNWRVTEYDRGTGRALVGGTPAVTVDNTVPRFHGTAGELQTSTVVIKDDGSLEQTSTGTSTIPSGSTAQRIVPANGMAGFRYNGTISRLEYYTGTWLSVQKQDWDYTSAEQTVAASGVQFTLAHGLGALPTKFSLVLRCKVIDRGWAVGDEIQMPFSTDTGAGNTTLGVNTTNLILSGSPPRIANGTTGAEFQTITVASWRWVIRASL